MTSRGPTPPWRRREEGHKAGWRAGYSLTQEGRRLWWFSTFSFEITWDWQEAAKTVERCQLPSSHLPAMWTFLQSLWNHELCGISTAQHYWVSVVFLYFAPVLWAWPWAWPRMHTGLSSQSVLVTQDPSISEERWAGTSKNLLSVWCFLVSLDY